MRQLLFRGSSGQGRPQTGGGTRAAFSRDAAIPVVTLMHVLALPGNTWNNRVLGGRE